MSHWEAARPSRACAYLADDDHGPLALQEILLADCPAVGVRTGAPFSQDGVTGMFVDRLPPGAKCVTTDSDAAALVDSLESLRRAVELDRGFARAAAAEEFDTDRVVRRILMALDESRMCMRVNNDGASGRQGLDGSITLGRFEAFPCPGRSWMLR